MKNHRMLMIACVPSMIGQFNMNNIHILKELGYEVDVACDFTDRSIWTDEPITGFKRQLDSLEVSYFQIDFSRSVGSLKKHWISYYQVKKLCVERKYEFVHCHTPIASAITRLVCKGLDINVIYTAHGFHFYKGAPLKNWILFYPIERWLSRYTDVLITINNEDYERSKKTFKMKCLEYVPGIGIDTKKFILKDFDRESYRRELGLSKKDVMLFSVGELNTNKNHKIVIRALGESHIRNFHYFIAGEGNLRNDLECFAKKCGLHNNIHLLGFRNDVRELYKCSDIYIHPSIREGLPVSLMEALASGLSVVCSDIRGNKDVVKDPERRFDPKNHKEILKILQSNKIRFDKYHVDMDVFSKEKVGSKMKKIYIRIGG